MAPVAARLHYAEAAAHRFCGLHAEGRQPDLQRAPEMCIRDRKKDANSQVVLNRLFAQTQLQSSFAINMLALVQNLSLIHI